jgi:hypothetical protein
MRHAFFMLFQIERRKCQRQNKRRQMRFDIALKHNDLAEESVVSLVVIPSDFYF